MIDKNKKHLWPVFTTIYVIVVLGLFFAAVIDTILTGKSIGYYYASILLYGYSWGVLYFLLMFFTIKNEYKNHKIKREHPGNTKPLASIWIRIVVFLLGLAFISHWLYFLHGVIRDELLLGLAIWAVLFIDSILGKPQVINSKSLPLPIQTSNNPPENYPVKSTPKIAPTHKPKKNDDGLGAIMAIVLITGLVVIGAMVISNQSLSKSMAQSKSKTATPVQPTKTTISNFASTYVNSGASSSCVLWSSITLADVGKTMCVYGTVRRTWFSEQQWTQYFTFSSDSQAIYFQKFSYVFDPGIDGRCIQFTGKIYRSYNTPYMDLQPNDAITFCD